MNEELVKTMAVGGRSIPGQSLTNDPENPAPFEKPPKFTSVQDASMDIFENLVDEESIDTIVDSMDDGIPIMDITQAILFKGFTDGKWNGDLMMMLMEPVAYMLLAISERYGIEARIDHEDDEDEGGAMRTIKQKDSRIQRMKSVKEKAKASAVPKGSLDPKMMETVEGLPDREKMLSDLDTEEEIDPTSLMAKPEEEEV